MRRYLELTVEELYSARFTDDERAELEEWLAEDLLYLPNEIRTLHLVDEGLVDVRHLVLVNGRLGEYLLRDDELVWRWTLQASTVAPPFLERWTMR